MRWFSCLALLLVVVAQASPRADGVEGPADRPDAALGKRVENFTLPDFHGRNHALADYRDRIVVLAFLGTECPLAKSYAPRLRDLAAEFEKRGVVFLAIDSNVQDSLAELTTFARDTGITFPLLKDNNNLVADQLGAERTPEVFLLDRQHVIRYRGKIDDQYGLTPGSGYARPKLGRRYLAEAVENLLAGQPVSRPLVAAEGCLIGRVAKVQPHGDVTYAKQIARIFQNRCQDCHRPGELAPFSMLTYDDVVGWAEMIREVVDDGRMPPWFAASPRGHFQNDPRLTDEEKELIRAWVENGCPKGDDRDLPPPPQFAEGWQMGEPDQVIYMSDKPFAVPAEGAVDYQYFTVDPGWTTDKWIQATEMRPGNPAVVHHIVAVVQPANVSDVIPHLGIGLYLPGNSPNVCPPGTAIHVPAHSKLIFQLHYTPNGTPQQDRSQLGVRFADPRTVKKMVHGARLNHEGIRIPPGAADYRAQTQEVLARDTLLLSITPHMHLRGKSFHLAAEYPDGGRETLLDVPHYDFNWQIRHLLPEPKRLPKGTRLVCTGTFDNSGDNPANPDPTQEVHYGDQSWQEMLVAYYTSLDAAEDVACMALVAQSLAMSDQAPTTSAPTRQSGGEAGAIQAQASPRADGVEGPADRPDAALGKRVENFTLPDFHGRNHALADYRDRIVVLAFLGTECPLAKSYAPRLRDLAAEFEKRGVVFLAIDSNVQDSLAELTTFARDTGITFPLLKDNNNLVADQLGAERTPEVFLLDRQHVIRYRGKIDDQYGLTPGSGYARPKLGRRYLAEAVENLLAGQPVSRPLVAAEGCLIGRVAKVQPHGDVTYAKQIARIFQNRCQDCHRPGELAPFSMLTYDDVVGWAEMIREVVDDGRMPPWFAASPRGHFQNDPRLTDEEKELIRAWVENGCPKGDDRDLPPPRQFAQGWQMGEPDQVIYMSDKPFVLPAEGFVDFKTFEVDPGWTTDKWIQATETRPGNRAVVHHLRVEARPQNVSDAFPREGIGLYAPGFIPNVWPEGTAIYVPAGSKLIFQLHYQPNGTRQEDRSLIGIRFADPRTVKKMVNATTIESVDFKIPPGAANLDVKATELVMKDMLLLSVTPHMHSRGRSFRMEAEWADGSKELLLDVPRYDFNWQLRYIFREPKLIPRGTRLHCIGTFDNSADNPSNPDPTVTVLPGNQTSDEMMQGNYYALDAGPDAAALALRSGSRAAASAASGGLAAEVKALFDLGEKNTPSAISVARARYQQVKAAHPQDARIDYVMALVLANQGQYAQATKLFDRYLAAGDADSGARCAKMWVDGFTQRFGELAAGAQALTTELTAGEGTSPTRDRAAARFLGVVSAYLERVKPDALAEQRRRDLLDELSRRLAAAYAEDFAAGRQSVVERLGDLESQDREYEQFLAEVASLKADAAPGRPRDDVEAATQRSPAGIDVSATSFSNYARFPYEQERQRVLGWYQK